MLLAETLDAKFGGASTLFNEEMRQCKFRICIALADPGKHGVKVWSEMTEIDLMRDVADIVDDKRILEAFQTAGMISRKRNQITHLMIDKTKEVIVQNIYTSMAPPIAKIAIEKVYDQIFECLNLGRMNCREFLREKFITKCSLNSLHESFAGNSIPHVQLKIMPIYTI